MPKARVLAVDDQLYFRTFLEGLLAEEGFEVETAASGAEALHALERAPGVHAAEAFRAAPARLRFGPREERASLTGLETGAQLSRLVDRNLEPVEPPLSHLVVTDIPIPHGAALVNANKQLLAINYRFVPDSDRRCIAVPAETVRAWLRPEGPPPDRGPSADPEAR